MFVFPIGTFRRGVSHDLLEAIFDLDSGNLAGIELIIEDGSDDSSQSQHEGKHDQKHPPADQNQISRLTSNTRADCMGFVMNDFS